MQYFKFNKELYSKVALIKAAYNFTDIAYIHLDVDEKYYLISVKPKEANKKITEEDFESEMLSQSVRHEVYLQTKNIRELMLARTVATSVVAQEGTFEYDLDPQDSFTEDEILKDWFISNE